TTCSWHLRLAFGIQAALFIGPLCGDARRHHQLGDDDPGARPLAGDAVELELIVRAVDDAQPFVHVAQTNSAARHAVHVRGVHADAVVDHVDDGVTVLAPALDRDAAVADLLRQAVLD